jgi:hypothetical protein
VTEELKRLLDLYSALQECAPSEQARHQKAFKEAVKTTAAAHKLDHWRVTAHIVRQWEVMIQREEKRKGQDKGQSLLSLDNPTNE